MKEVSVQVDPRERTDEVVFFRIREPIPLCVRMGDLDVLQVVRELRSIDPSTVRVNDVAFEEIEACLVAQAQVVRVPDEARVPLEEGLYTPDHLGSYGFQTCDEVGELRRVGSPQGAAHGRPRSVYRRSDGGAGDLRAEPLDVEGIVQEGVAGILRVIGDVEDGVHAQNVRKHEEVQVQR